MSHVGKYSTYLRKSYVRYATILILILTVIFFVFIYYGLRFTAINTNESCNASLNTVLKSQCNTYAKNIDDISDSSEFKQALKHQNVTDAYRTLYSFTTSQKIKSNFYMFDSSKKLILTNLYTPNRIILQQNNKIMEAINIEESSPYQVYNGASCIQYNNNQQTSYLFCKAVMSEQKIIGYLCFDFTTDSLNSIMRKNEVEIVVLSDQFDNAFYYTDNSVVNELGKCQINWGKNNMVNITVSNKPYFAYRTTLPNYNIQVITLTSIRAQNQVMNVGILMLVSLIILMGILISIFSKIAARNNYQTIDALLYAVEQCGKGNIGYRIDSVTFDEFQIVYEKFNDMMKKLQLLIQNNNELRERKRIIEARELEKQFNPHFVFNVMEMLKYEILIDPHKASKMVVVFANLMRYSIHSENVKVPLQTDINYVKDYLILQKMRFSNRLSYSIEIQPEIINYPIPKLLVQPVVENCLSHGIKDMERIEIQITGKLVDGKIVLKVSDNGCGITKEKLNKIRSLINCEDSLPNHIGLYDVQREIKLIYGNQYGIIINSKHGNGTTVKIVIPFEEGKDKNCIK